MAAGLRSIQGRRLVAWVLEHFAVKFYLTGRNGVNEASVGVRQIEIYSSIARYEDVFILHGSLSSSVTAQAPPTEVKEAEPLKGQLAATLILYIFEKCIATGGYSG